MADEKIVTSIVANSDFSNLIADVQRVTSSLFKLQQEFAGANRALAGQIDAANAMFNQNMLKTGQFSSHFVSLTSDVEKFGKNLDGGRLKLRDYFRAYQEHSRTSGGLIRDLAKQQVQLQNAVLQPLGKNAQGLMQYNVHIPRGLDLVKNKTSLLRQEFQIMNKVIQDGGVQLINWGKNTQWAGRQLTVGLTLPLAAFGKAAADAFKVADQELTRLTKVYGDVAGTSAQELGKIRNEVAATAKELSSAMGVNFAETIGLAADIAATGKTGDELLSSVSETTRLAVLGEVDRQEAMKATLAIQSAFKSNTQELAETINFLNAVENQTSTTLNDLVEAIPKAGPVIKGLGGSVQDLALYLTAMREGGINASEGANALKSALASLINPTDVAVDKFKGFGIDLLGIVKNNAGDVTGTLLALQSALDRLDPLSKQQAIEQLFGKFQFSRLNALFENLGRQGSQTLQVLDLMKASAGELEAVAGRELAAVTESASGRYRRAVEGLKAELAGVGDEFLDIGTKLINVLSKIIDFAQKLPDPIKKLMAFGGAFTAIIGPVIMLTGVLANFFGYIIKGLGHFKALFRGAEGFQLLTPEIIAAKNASSMLSDEFYSDAKAADTLSLAIQRLNEDLKGLQVNASNATSTTNALGATIATAAGTPIMTVGGGLGAPRVTDPNHPLVGPETRAAAHLNPRDPNNPSSIFGLTLQPVPVNRKIGATPQILMSERLPDVPGLTTVSGVSTGVVAAEHAKFAALMATLGVQSQQEIDALKKTIGLGGQVSRELLDTFDDILPITQRLTANAAAQSASIVAELKAGTINVQQARAQIIAVNAQLEAMMGAEVSAYAAKRGRTIDLTKAPLINQPVVDIAGKPNIRGAYRSGIFLDVMESLGRATGTKSFGGPYSIETTRPIKRNTGGGVFYNDGNQVPGPNVNADVVPAMLTPGEFVIRRDVAQQDPDGMRALNEGRAIVIPVQRNIGGVIPLLRALQTRRRSISGLRVAGERSGRQAYTPGQLNFEAMSRSPKRGGTTIPRLQESGYLTQEEAASLSTMIGAHGVSRRFISNIGSRTAQGAYPTSSFEDVYNRFTLTGSMTPTGSRRSAAQRYIAEGRTAQILPGSVVHIPDALNKRISSGTATRADFANIQGYQMTNLLDFLSARGIPTQLARKIANDAANKLKASLPSKNIGESSWAKAIEKAEQSAIISNAKELSQYSMAFAANRGGMVPGYNAGGVVSRAGLLAKLGAKFKYEGKTFDGPQSLKTYKINAMDIQGGKKYFGHIPGLSDKARGALYDATLDYFNTSKITGPKIDGKRMFNPTSMLTAFPTIAQFAVTSNKSWLPESDLAILQSFANKGASLGGTVGSSVSGMAKVYGKLFSANNGGMVPGYNVGGLIPSQNGQKYGSGGMVPRYQFGGNVRGSGILRSLLFGSLGSMAGSTIGSRFGQTGSMMGGMLGYMLPDLLMGRAGRSGITPSQRLGIQTSVPNPNFIFGSPISAQNPMFTASTAPSIPGRQQSIFAGTRAASSIAGMAESTGRFTPIIGKALAGITRLNVALGLVAGSAALAKKAFDNYNETQRLSAAAFGLTSESAEKAGLQFTNYNTKIKDAVAAQKLMIDQNMITYESLASAGTPFKMTIEEYKKLRKELKETMAEQIKVINATSRPDAARVAVQLKEQLMAAGLSAEEAAKRIYTLFNLSNKAGQSVSVINTDAFRGIVDAQTAAASALQSFNYAKNFENTRDQAAALNTALTAINTGVEDYVSESEKAAKKKKQEFNETEARYKAEQKMLDIIASKVKSQESIGQGVLQNLKKQNPEIEKFVNAQDTAVSVFQKLRLVARGFTGDLADLNAQQVDAVYKLQIATAQAVATVNKKGLLSAETKAYKELKKQRDDLAAAAKGQSVKEQIDARERLKALDKEIKKINDKAEARKKALREEAQAQDMALRLQQQQLEYEKAVAAGDFAGAATAKIELQRLQNEQQVTLTEQQIEERRLKDIKPLELEKERLQNAQDALANKAALAAESLESINKRLEKQKEKIDAVNDAMTNLKVAMDLNKDDLENFKQSDEFKGLAGKLVDAVRGTGQTVATTSLPDVAQGRLKEDIGTMATDLLSKYGSEITTIVAQKGVTVTATGNIIVDGKKIDMDADYSGDRKTKSGETFGAEKQTVKAKTLKEAGAQAQTGKKTQTYVPATGGPGFDVFEWNGKTYAIDKSNGVIYNFDAKNQKLGDRAKYASGGLLRGPGTKTSDSIIGMYANGGMVRVSNGEYIVNADTVSKLGVPFFDRINGMKNGGLMLNYDIPRYEHGGPMVQTMPYNPDGGSSVYKIGSVTMQFAEAPANGRQLFEEFKVAMALEQRKSNPERNISRRYN